MTTDTSWVGPAMTQTVHWVRTVGITFGETTAQRAVVHLPMPPTCTATSAARTPR